MNKRNRIIYWIATVWLSLGMTSSAVVQLSRMEEEVQSFKNLGYPEYLLTILGIWKLLGVIAILLPKFPLVKEWAYAGFLFVTTGAFCSHVISGDGAAEILPSVLLTALTVASWYFRPSNRKL